MCVCVRDNTKERKRKKETVCVRGSVLIYVRAHVCACTACACMSVYVCVCMCVCVWMCVRTWRGGMGGVRGHTERESTKERASKRERDTEMACFRDGEGKWGVCRKRKGQGSARRGR